MYYVWNILMYICTYVLSVCHKLMDYSQQRDIEQTDGRTHVCIYLKMCVYLLLYCRCCCCRRHRYWRSRSFCYCFYSLLCLASSPSKRPTSCLLFLISLQRYYDVCIWFCVYVCLSVFIQTNGIYIRMYVCVPSLPLPFVGVVAVFAPLIAHFVLKFACFFGGWTNICSMISFLPSNTRISLRLCVCASFTWIWELFCVNVIFVMSIPLSFSHCYTKRVYLLFVISVVFGVVGVVAVFVLYETMCCIIYAFSLVSFIFMCFKRISQQQYAI